MFLIITLAFSSSSSFVLGTFLSSREILYQNLVVQLMSQFPEASFKKN